MIPEDWKYISLTKLFPKIVVGYVGTVSEHYCELGDGIPFYRTQNVKDCKLSHGNLMYVTPAFHKSNKKSQIENEDILIARVGANLGLVCKVTGLKNEANAANVIIIKSQEGSNSDFYTYFLSSPSGQSQIKSAAGGGAQGVFNTNLSKKIQVPNISVIEQCKIAEIIGVWDESIDLLERLIGRVRSRKQGLMQQLLTGKKRFKEFEGSDNRQKTLYGSLPSDWKYIPITDIAQEYSTKNKEANNLTVLSCSKYKGLVNSLEYFGKQVFSEDTSTYKIVEYGMFAYATNHIDEGSIGYQNLCDKALISPMYTVFKTDSNRVHDLFLYSVLKTEYYRQIFSINTSASVERRGSLRWKDFSKIKIPLPSLPEQEKIAAVLSVADEEISTLEQQLAAYKQQKLGLMQQLLTGRIRI